jgi:hypothetical protein
MFSPSAPIPQVPLQSGVELNGTRVAAYHSMVLIDREEVLSFTYQLQRCDHSTDWLHVRPEALAVRS